MELPTALLPQAKTISVFNKNVLKDSVTWEEYLYNPDVSATPTDFKWGGFDFGIFVLW